MQYATQSIFKFTLADKGIKHGVGSLIKNKEGKSVNSYIYGEWHTFRNGKEPFFNEIYDGNINRNLTPGTKNFEYEKTWP